MRVVTGDNGQVNGLVTENAIPLHPELQSARCMSNRYRPDLFPRCVSCTRRWAGDTCRFQGIRFFIKDKKRDIVGISFVGGRYQDAPKMFYPLKWNVPLKEAHIKRMKVGIPHPPSHIHQTKNLFSPSSFWLVEHRQGFIAHSQERVRTHSSYRIDSPSTGE